MLGKIKKAKVWMVGAALVAMSGLAVAAGPGFGRGWGYNADCPGGGAYDRLNLTAEQKTKMNELREKTWKDTVTLRNEMQTKRLELRTLWTNPNPDKDKIAAKQKELNALRDKLQATMTDSKIEARKFLTPEQAAELATSGPGMGFGGHGWGKGRMMGGRGGMGAGPCGGGFGPGPGSGRGFGPGPGGARL
ncbi:MAG: Spy/CpxP family protein refolding chaperone [Deltaproteobacteria bacterium]|nr:Spy/CpxP family protein refolding chaperone [Deltaproteobacteria bacterium]